MTLLSRLSTLPLLSAISRVSAIFHLSTLFGLVSIGRRGDKHPVLLILLMLVFGVSACSDSSTGSKKEEEKPEVLSPELVYFWFFGAQLPNDTELVTIDPVFPEASDAALHYLSSLPGYPNTDRRASMERRNLPTEMNYRKEGNNGIDFQESDMRGLQVRQPFRLDSEENTMILHMPTYGYTSVVFTMAVIDEGAADALLFDYSTTSSDAHAWTTNGLEANQITQQLRDEYRLFTVDFSEVAASADNEHFRLRIRFQVPDGSAEDGARVTFNNMALDGVPIHQTVPN